MGSRRTIPLAILAVLTLLTLVFAVVALFMSPSGPTLTVDNATGATYGVPPGSQSLSLQDTTGRVSRPVTSAALQVRFLNFSPPNHMAVTQTYPRQARLGPITGHQVDSILASFAAMTGGSTPWVAAGNAFTRHESLSTFLERSYGESRPAGTISETAVVQNGLLVAFHYRAVIPHQTLAGGQVQTAAVITETVHILSVNGQRTPALSF